MNILELTLVKALERMRAREFSAVEYVQAMLERNREVVHLNAVICLDEDRLLHAASQRDGHRQDNDNPALPGAPVLLKDNINSADLPTTGCTPALKGHFPPANAPVAQLLLDAGAVGLADNGLPVGVCLEGPAGTDRKILAIGKALQDEVGFLPRPGIRAKGEGIEFRPHSTKQ